MNSEELKDFISDFFYFLLKNKYATEEVSVNCKGRNGEIETKQDSVLKIPMSEDFDQILDKFIDEKTK